MCFVHRVGFAANSVYSGKFAAIATWLLYSPGDATRVALLVSDDGTTGAGHASSVQKVSAVSINRLSCVTVSYDYVADGTSVGNVWVDELAVATNAAMDGPPFNSANTFNIGSTASGGNIPADFYVYAYYPGVLVAADHQRLSRWFHGLYDGTLSNVITVTSATSPSVQVAPAASGMYPFIMDMPANVTHVSAIAAGSGGVYAASALTNKCWRGSF